MAKHLGGVIHGARKDGKLSQDEYGAQFGVSGPAISKFEQGQVSPSLELWLRMSAAAGLNQRRAVLLWVRNRLPRQYQQYIELQTGAASASRKSGAAPARRPAKPPAYSRCSGRAEQLAMMKAEPDAPKGLIAFMEDDELWSLYKPAGAELESLNGLFAPLGQGSKEQYRQALRLLREF